MPRPMFRRPPGRLKHCAMCGELMREWPKGGAIIENRTGTEEKSVCLICLDKILNSPGVEVISDNVGRDQ